MVAVLAAKDVPLRRPLQIYFASGCAAMAVVLALHFAGIVAPDLTSERMGALRGTYGYGHPNTFGGLVFGLGWFLTGFASTIPVLYISFGLLVGVCDGICYNLALAMLRGGTLTSAVSPTAWLWPSWPSTVVHGSYGQHDHRELQREHRVQHRGRVLHRRLHRVVPLPQDACC